MPLQSGGAAAVAARKGAPARRGTHAIESLENRTLLSVLISDIDPDPPPHELVRDFVPVPNATTTIAYDRTRREIFIPTSDGRLFRYDVRADALLYAIPVGTSLAGGDVSPDGRYFYTGEAARYGDTGDTGTFYRVRVADGHVDAVHYPLRPFEAGPGAYFAATLDGVFFTNTDRMNPGWDSAESVDREPLRKYDPATGTVSVVTTLPIGFGGLAFGKAVRSADHSLAVFTGVGGSAVYDARTGEFARRQTDEPHEVDGVDMSPVVSRDGTYTATEPSSIRDRQLRPAREVPADVVPLAFDAERDLVYTGRKLYGTITVRKTDDWSVVAEYVSHDLGESYTTPHVAVGGYVFECGPGSGGQTGAGIVRYRLASWPDVAVVAPTLLAPGQRATFNVTARDPFGDLDPAYTGTIHFTCSDPDAVLPPDYTFAPADGGVRTFDVVFGTAGPQQVRARDTSNDAADSGAPFDVDGTGPAAQFEPGTAVVAGAPSAVTTLTFNDPSGVDANSIDGDELVVVGPGGAMLAARRLAEPADPGPPTSRQARYEVAAPGGHWDAADNGTYRVRLTAGSVADVLGNRSAETDADLGTFEVSLPAEAPELSAVLVPDWPRQPLRTGDVVRATLVVRNDGRAAPAAAAAVDVVISTDDVVDAADPVLGSFTIDPADVPPGAEKRTAVTLRVPELDKPGVFRVLTRVDSANSVAELDETNNVSVGAAVAMPSSSADVAVVVDAPAPPPQMVRGRTLVVRVRLANLGSASTRGVYGVQLLRSRGTPDDPRYLRVLRNVRRVRLRAGESRTALLRLKLSRKLIAGDYVLSAGFGAAPGADDVDPENSAVGGPLQIL